MLAFRHVLTALSIGCVVTFSGAAPVLACVEEEVAAPVGPFSDQVVLSEIYPAPTSGTEEEEFIELYNGGSATVDLAGWLVADASGRKYEISADDFLSTTVAAGGYFVVPFSVSKIYLNNDGDTVSLLQPDEVLLDTTEYADAETALSWSLVGAKWEWSTRATGGAKNVSSPVEEADSEAADEPSDEEAEPGLDAARFEQSDQIRLSELLPNPSGSETTDEWIELVNTGETPVYLGGWQLTDQSRYFAVGDLSIGAGEYLVFAISETAINLNNTGDTLYLIDPMGEIVAGTEYGNAAEDQAWTWLDDGSWAWSEQSTPGEANVLAITAEATDTSGESVASATASNEETGDLLAIAQLRALEPGSPGAIEGVVTVLPGVFGTQYFYIQDETAGIQIYSYSKDFPELAVGDRVRVNGETSVARGELRLKTSSRDQISVLGSGDLPAPVVVTEFEEAVEGMLVAVSGIVTQSSSTSATINGVLELALKDGAGIDRELLAEGSQVAVSGIVTQADETYKLLPRSSEDIAVETETGVELVPAAEAAGTSSLIPPATDHQKNQNTTLLVLVIAGLATIMVGTVVRHKADTLRKLLHRKTSSALQAAGEPALNTPPTIFDSAPRPALKKKG